MPSAICNNCEELIHYKGHIKKQVCQCSSADLTAVSGHLQEGQWVYCDRKGTVRLIKVVEPFPVT